MNAQRVHAMKNFTHSHLPEIWASPDPEGGHALLSWPEHEAMARMAEDLPDLISQVKIDCQDGHNPSIYFRGEVWRYHLDMAGNQWADDRSPIAAARKARLSNDEIDTLDASREVQDER